MSKNTRLIPLTRPIALEFVKREDCDVVFCIDEKTIEAHKFILKVRNQLLYEKSLGWNAEKEPICIEDVEYDTFKALLKYMYTDKLSLTNANVLSFLSASVVLKMQQLEQLCCFHILKSFNPKNVCYYMNLAIDVGSTTLQDRCCFLFSKQTSNILFTQSFLQLSQPALSALLDVQMTNVLEIGPLHCVKRWMTHQCEDRHLPVNGMNMQKVIGDALYKIRFPTMTVHDFANSVATIEGFLTDSETLQIFKKIHIVDGAHVECPFSDEYRCQSTIDDFSHLIKNLCSAKIFEDGEHKPCDALEFIESIKHDSDCSVINFTPLWVLLQCCVDLANNAGLYIWDNRVEEDGALLLETFMSLKHGISRSTNKADLVKKFTTLKHNINKLCSLP